MTRHSITAVLGSLLVAVFVTVQSVAASIAPSVDGSSFGYRFLEVNTTMLPSAITADIGPSGLTAGQWRFVESNAITLPDQVPAIVTPASVTMAQWRFLEVNTLLPQTFVQTYMEDLTPNPGHPY
jgi:hypothetical protein